MSTFAKQIEPDASESMVSDATLLRDMVQEIEHTPWFQYLRSYVPALNRVAALLEEMGL